MSSASYGLNFGFRRSDEDLSIREGQFRTPKTGTSPLQGQPVMIDAATPGYLKLAPANQDHQVGLTGLLVQEEDHYGSVFSAVPLLGHDSLDLGPTRNDQLSTMWAGAGVKVWFKNTDAYDRGTRHKDAVTMVDLTGVAVGDQLGWDGAKWVKAVDGTTPGWMTVVKVVGSDYCEAVLTA